MLFSQNISNVGVGLAMVFMIHFFLMLFYNMFANYFDWPAPMDWDYFIGRVNTVIFFTLLVSSAILIII